MQESAVAAAMLCAIWDCRCSCVLVKHVARRSQRALSLPHYSPMLKHLRRGPFAALFVIITLHTSGHIKYAVLVDDWSLRRCFCWAAGDECERSQCFHKFQVTL